jgi:hypothetical protein
LQLVANKCKIVFQRHPNNQLSFQPMGTTKPTKMQES